MLVSEVFNGLTNVDDLARIQPYSRLVEDQHGRIVEQRLRQANPLAIAFREIADEATLHLLHAAQFHHLADFARTLTARDALHFSDEMQVAIDGHFLVQGYVLRQVAHALTHGERLRKDVIAGDHSATTTGWHETSQDAHGGRFPGAIGS